MNSYFLIAKPKGQKQAYILYHSAKFGGSKLWEIDQFTLTKTKKQLDDYARRLYPEISENIDIEIYILQVSKDNDIYHFKILSCIHNINTENTQQKETLEWLLDIFHSKREMKSLPASQTYEKYMTRMLNHIKLNRSRTMQMISTSSIVSAYLKEQFTEYLDITRKNFYTVEKNIRKACLDYKTLRGLSIQYFNTADNFPCVSTVQNKQDAFHAKYPIEVYGYIGTYSLTLSGANAGYYFSPNNKFSEESIDYLEQTILAKPFLNDEMDEIYHKYGIEGVLNCFDMNDIFSLKDYELVKLKKMDIITYVKRNGFSILEDSPKKHI